MDTATTPNTNTTATDGAKDAASEATDRARSAAADAAGQAQEKIADAAGQVKEQAAGAQAKAKSRLRDEIDGRSTEFGHRAEGTADDLRSVGDQLRQQGKEQPARLADQAADQVDRAAGYLKGTDADRFLDDLEAFGRQRPWAVIAGGLAVGFVASRFLKASSADRYHGSRTGGTGTGSSVPPPSATRPPASSYGATTGSAPAPASTPLDDLAATTAATATAASAPQPDLGGFAAREAPVPLDDAPVSTGSDPLTTTHRDRENGVGSDGAL